MKSESYESWFSLRRLKILFKVFLVTFFVSFSIIVYSKLAFAVLVADIERVSKEDDIVDLLHVQIEQENFRTENDEYIQVKKSETKGLYEINVYESPYGKGYQVVQFFDDRTEYIAFGADAKSFTYVDVFPVPVASTTERGDIR